LNTYKQHSTLPFYIFWGILICRNKNVFEQQEPNIRTTIIKIVAYYKEIGPIIRKDDKGNHKYIDIWSELQVGFFDGACIQSKCGCRAYIVLEPGKLSLFGGKDEVARTVGQQL